MRKLTNPRQKMILLDLVFFQQDEYLRKMKMKLNQMYIDYKSIVSRPSTQALLKCMKDTLFCDRKSEVRKD